MNKNEIFTLWIPPNNEDEIPMLAHLSLKSMILCGHDVILYTYSHLGNVPEGVTILDANEILDSSEIFMYKEGHGKYAGFADLFRLTRLYKYGGTWLDLDVLLIRNINEKFNDDILFCSEPMFHFYFYPNNGTIRFPKNHEFVKYMLDYAQEVGKDIVHGQTGPKLVTRMLKKFPEYNKYLKTFNIYCMLGWPYLNDFSKPPQKLLNKMDMDEFMGFHINNTFLDKITTKNPNGLFELLKKSILNSNSYDEYYNYLKEYRILDSESYDIIKDWDMKYLDTMDDIQNTSFKYTILIDSKNLRKVDIYNIIHSIGFESPNDMLCDFQILIFGKTNLGNDKIRFNDNITILSSDFKDIYPYIKEYIYGDYVIPLNQPILFCPKLFLNKTIENDIESYPIADNLFVNIINKKDFNSLMFTYNGNVFNLDNELLNGFNVKITKENFILNYEFISENIYELMQKIDDLDNIKDEDITFKFLKTKSELRNMKFNNLINEASYHYYTSYMNIMNSSSFHEFKLKEQNTRLNCLNAFYLNKLNTKYDFKI